MSGNLLSVTKTELDTIEEAIADIRDGKIIIVVDDEDRENEGDFVCAADRITPELITFMATYGRGLICTPIEEERAEELDLPMMVSSNTALHETAFTVSIDLIGHGCTTGISSYDRATGIKKLTESNTKKTDYARPGHIFPLRAKKGGVLRRTGHTEAAVDLARLAGLYPAGVLVEILNPDGTMARLPQLLEIASQHDLKIISIKDLVAYRMKTERLVEKELTMDIETSYGPFTLHAYRQTTNDVLHLALTHGSWLPNEPILTRVHSSTTSHDLLHRLMNDFGTGLSAPLRRISSEGKGVLLFMRPHQDSNQVINELKVLKSRLEEGLSIGREGQRSMSQRDFGVGAQILRDLQVTKLRLLTRSPKKRVGLIGYGLEVVENVEL
ncbi:MAG: 3,4-dihydroxy-2-butanone-4-phosphate synthase [Bacteroidota bacterium]